MNLLILRIIPYLYHFIKEQYRADVEGKPPTPKKRTKYRTIISVQAVVLIALGLYFGYTKYIGKENGKKVDAVKEVQSENAGSGFVSRETYEKDVRLLIRENVEQDYLIEKLSIETTKLCKLHPTDCNENTHHMIDQSQKENPNGK